MYALYNLCISVVEQTWSLVIGVHITACLSRHPCTEIVWINVLAFFKCSSQIAWVVYASSYFYMLQMSYINNQDILPILGIWVPHAWARSTSDFLENILKNIVIHKICRLDINLHFYALITYDTRSSWSNVCENGGIKKPSAAGLKTCAWVGKARYVELNTVFLGL